MDQPTAYSLRTICRLRYQNSGPRYAQYRLYFSTDDTQQILTWNHDKLADLRAGKHYSCWVYSLRDPKGGYLTESFSLIEQHEQVAINANVGTFLRKFAEQWDSRGRPDVEIEAHLAVADGAPRYELMLGLGLPGFPPLRTMG